MKTDKLPIKHLRGYVIETSNGRSRLVNVKTDNVIASCEAGNEKVLTGLYNDIIRIQKQKADAIKKVQEPRNEVLRKWSRKAS